MSLDARTTRDEGSGQENKPEGSTFVRRTLNPVADSPWGDLRFLTCSVLPVRMACNLRCPFCFSRSSISTLKQERTAWLALDLESYFAFARSKGATRLVITGGGEPLLRGQEVLETIRRGAAYFDEIACFTNGTFLTRALAAQMADAGLSYLCYSRHAAEDDANSTLMGSQAPRLHDFFEAAAPLKVRATCVMTKSYVAGPDEVWAYIDKLREYGVEEFTFKHTYLAYPGSVFAESKENQWVEGESVQEDPFAAHPDTLTVGALPWGPKIRKIRGVQVCYYHEPSPEWEIKTGIGRSLNLLADGKVYASLEEKQSLVYQLSTS